MGDADLTPVHDHKDLSDDEYLRMGVRLRNAREFLGLSQEAVADALKIPRASVSAIESGKRKVSSLELRDLARLYRRPMDSFYDQHEEDSTPAQSQADQALYRAVRELSDDDKEQVLKFAEFIKTSGQAPARRKAP
jgi:transcriptional regulator with XRE-family HTH domain